MKSLLKIFTAVVLVLTFIISVSVAVSAETYYVYDAYRYRDADWNAGTVYFSGMEEDVENLEIPDTIASKTVVGIDDYAFYNNTTLSSVDLSKAVHLYSIGISAFRGCGALKSLTVPETVNYLSEYMLRDCTSLKSLKINMSPTIIPSEMCNYCTSLENFEMPDSVTEIRRYAFGNCTSLSYVNIPPSVETIANSAFSNCPNLTLGVWYGTAGYDYAIAQNIPYVLLDGAKLGDVNGDGYININDVTALQSHLAEYNTLTGIAAYVADVDGSGEVKIDDATILQEFLAEYQVAYSIGEVVTQ